MLEVAAVVVSPLFIALMNDQVAALIANGISGSRHPFQSKRIETVRYRKCRYRQDKVKVCRPERLLADMDAWVRNVRISMFAIDEAHRISQWGLDFRPDCLPAYGGRGTFPGIPVMALTATADRLTRDDIVKQLGLVNPAALDRLVQPPQSVAQGDTERRQKQKVAVITEMLRKISQRFRNSVHARARVPKRRARL